MVRDLFLPAHSLIVEEPCLRSCGCRRVGWGQGQGRPGGRAARVRVSAGGARRHWLAGLRGRLAGGLAYANARQEPGRGIRSLSLTPVAVTNLYM